MKKFTVYYKYREYAATQLENGNVLLTAPKFPSRTLTPKKFAQAQESLTLLLKMKFIPEIKEWMKGPMVISMNLGDYEIARNVQTLINALMKGGGINLGSYGYFPTNKNFTRWVATDGSEVTGNILAIIWNYGGKDMFEDFVGYMPEYILEQFYLQKKVRQQEFEGNNL